MNCYGDNQLQYFFLSTYAKHRRSYLQSECWNTDVQCWVQTQVGTIIIILPSRISKNVSFRLSVLLGDSSVLSVSTASQLGGLRKEPGEGNVFLLFCLISLLYLASNGYAVWCDQLNQTFWKLMKLEICTQKISYSIIFNY